jgi:hypothetical protein
VEGKQCVFAAKLGFISNDAEELQAAIYAAILLHDATLSEKDEHGQRYTLDFPISRLGTQATSRTTWIIRTIEEFPRLTSCYILKEKTSE